MNCEAPIHVDGCNGQGTTDDHFTPRCILRKLKIKDTPENHQWLSIPCHRAKDKDTPLRNQVLGLEKQGIIFSFEEHRKIFQEGSLGEYESRFRTNSRRRNRRTQPPYKRHTYKGRR
ncbi:hypothetical protein M0R04_13430 [Candidatus Dojkabacteria bacterium]|jgi:hypothetical protein|nr:hypothetical protein [Candidatus Dojkabacteria bacterium]